MTSNLSIAPGRGPRWQLRDEAATHIRSLILSGRLIPGTYVRLEPLANEFGTSVTPVREAMMMLREQGYVDLRPNRGFIVQPFSLADLNDLFLVQSLIGKELIARAAARIDDEALLELERLNSDLASLAAEGDGRRFEVVNDEFHAAINECADSPRLVWMYNAALPLPRYFSTIPDWMEVSLRDHRLIVRALRKHDAERSQVLMERHVRHAGDLLTRHLANNGRWPSPPPG
jgi:DNA-binding GntR family transcriptional regulator